MDLRSLDTLFQHEGCTCSVGKELNNTKIPWQLARGGVESLNVDAIPLPLPSQFAAPYPKKAMTHFKRKFWDNRQSSGSHQTKM